MTIETIIKCDGHACHEVIEVDECDSVEVTLIYAGWHKDPENGWEHLCPDCWPERQKYLSNYGMDSGLEDQE